MRKDYKSWLKAQQYSDKTISSQISQTRRLEEAYGPLEDVVEGGGYDALFQDLYYSTDDERHNRPNPSKFSIQGNLRKNLASYKTSLALYGRFLASAAPLVPAKDTALSSSASMAPESADAQKLSLERDMQRHLRVNIASLDPGLTIVDEGAERAVKSGSIDILAQEADGTLVVIELKAGKTDARVVGQVLGYMGDLADEDCPKALRGIIVAHEFDQRTKSAARAVPNLTLMRYAVSFSFSPEP